MVHQFEAEKCLHAALTGNLVLWHYVIGSTPGKFRWYKSRDPGWKLGKIPGGFPGGGGDVGAWNWLMHKNQIKLYSLRPTYDLSNSCFESKSHLACRIVSKLKWLGGTYWCNFGKLTKQILKIWYFPVNHFLTPNALEDGNTAGGCSLG